MVGSGGNVLARAALAAALCMLVAACDKAVEVDSSHMGFAVSKKGTRAAVREIVRFLREIEAPESRH